MMVRVPAAADLLLANVHVLLPNFHVGGRSCGETSRTSAVLKMLTPRSAALSGVALDTVNTHTHTHTHTHTTWQEVGQLATMEEDRAHFGAW
jgi:hypothetical protein